MININLFCQNQIEKDITAYFKYFHGMNFLWFLYWYNSLILLEDDFFSDCGSFPYKTQIFSPPDGKLILRILLKPDDQLQHEKSSDGSSPETKIETNLNTKRSERQMIQETTGVCIYLSTPNASKNENVSIYKIFDFWDVF